MKDHIVDRGEPEEEETETGMWKEIRELGVAEVAPVCAAEPAVALKAPRARTPGQEQGVPRPSRSGAGTGPDPALGGPAAEAAPRELPLPPAPSLPSQTCLRSRLPQVLPGERAASRLLLQAQR